MSKDHDDDAVMRRHWLETERAVADLEPCEHGNLVTCAACDAEQDALVAACAARGHKDADGKCGLVSDDWAGPDSGGMAVHCALCGWEFEHVLY